MKLKFFLSEVFVCLGHIPFVPCQLQHPHSHSFDLADSISGDMEIYHDKVIKIEIKKVNFYSRFPTLAVRVCTVQRCKMVLAAGFGEFINIVYGIFIQGFQSFQPVYFME